MPSRRQGAPAQPVVFVAWGQNVVSDETPRESRHKWYDTSLMRPGVGWKPGERFRCDRCGIIRCIIYGTDKDGNPTRVGLSLMYFEENGRRTDVMPRCK